MGDEINSPKLDTSSLANSAEEAAGARTRKRNAWISGICFVLFAGLLVWGSRTGALADTNQIRALIEGAGWFGPILFILISVFTCYVPIIPLGSMGSIGIVLFGWGPAFIYNTITSYLNCFLAYWLARKYGTKILLQFAAPKTVEKYQNWLSNSKHLELIFFLLMMMPISPDIILCMLVGMSSMKFSHFAAIIFISRPFSSWCYSAGMLKLFEWLAKLVHLKG